MSNKQIKENKTFEVTKEFIDNLINLINEKRVGETSDS